MMKPYPISSILLLIFLLCVMNLARAQEPVAPILLDERDQQMRERYGRMLERNPFQERSFDQVYESYLNNEGVEAWIEILTPKTEGDAQDIHALLLLGQIYNRRFDTANAVSVLERAANLGESRPQLKVLLGTLYYKTGQNERAAELLTQALEAITDVDERTQVSRMLGNIFLRSGSREEAIEVWSAITEQNPNEIFTQLELAEIYEDNRLWDKAIEVYRRIVELAQDDPYRRCRSLRSVAQGMIHLERYPEAIAVLEEAMELVAPGNWLFEDLKLRLISVYQDIGDLSGLVTYLQTKLEQSPHDLEYRDLLAETYIRMARFDEAEAAYRLILERDPSKTVVYEKLISLYERTQNTDQQTAMLEKLIETYPHEADYYRRLGEQHLRNGDAESAKQTWVRWSETDNSAVRLADLAGWYEAYEYLDEAVDAYRRALELQPNKEWRFRLAGILFQQGNREEALEVWQSVLNEESAAAEYAEVAAILNSNQFTEEPDALLQKAIELEPDNPEFRLAYARDRMRHEAYETALAEFEILAALTDSEYFRGQGEKGRLDAYSEMGILEEKQQEWEAELAEDPENIEKITRLSSLYARAGHREKALELLERRLSADPDHPQFMAELAEAYTSARRIDEAIELYQTLSEIDKNRARIYQKELLEIYLAADLRDEAIATAEKIVDLAASDPEARLDLGQVYQLYNEIDQALQQYRYALRLAPEVADYYRQYGEALSAERQWGEAQNAFRKMLEVADTDETRMAAVRNLALIYLQQNMLDELVTEFQRRIRNTPKRLAAYEELAAVYKEAGQIFRSVEILENALEEVDDKEPALKRLIRESYDAQDFERVKNYYEQLIAMSGQPSAFEYERLGKIYAQLGEIEKAKATWSQIVEDNPDDPKALQQYAKLLRDEGFSEEAMVAMAHAVERDEYNYRLRYEYAQFLSQNDQPAQAIEELKKILELGEQAEEEKEESREKKVSRLNRGRPNSSINPYMFVYGLQRYGGRYFGGSWQGGYNAFRPQVISLMANIAQNSVGIDPLLESYQERLEKEANNTELRHDLLLIYQAFGQYDPALQVAEELMEFKPDDVELMQQTALLYSSNQKIPEAIALLEKMAETQPTYRSQALQGMIPLYMNSGEEEKSKELAKQLIAENPNDYPTISMMSQLMMQQGQFDLAIEFLDSADVSDPRYRTSLQQIKANIFQQKGDTENALAAYKEVLLADNSIYRGVLTHRRQMKVYAPVLTNNSGGRGYVVYSGQPNMLPNTVVQSFDYTKANALAQIIGLQKSKEDAPDVLQELEDSVQNYSDAVSAAEKNQAWENAKMLMATYFNEKEFDKINEALTYFKNHGMDQVEWYNLAIYTAEQQQDFDAMKALYDELEALYPAKSREIMQGRVITSILQEDFETTAGYIRELNQRRIPPTELVTLIQHIEQAGKADLAKELLEEHLSQVSRNSQALALLAKLYAENSEYDKAIELAYEAWDRKSQGGGRQTLYYSGGTYYSYSGGMYYSMGAGAPTDYLLRELHQYHVSAGKSDELIARFQEKLEKQPGSVQLHENLAQLYELNNDRDKAIETYLSLIEKRPNVMSAKIKLANLYRQQGKVAEAKEIYEDLLKTHPNAYEQISWQLRDIYQRMGKGQELAEIEETMAQRATNPNQIRNLAQQYLQRGEYDKAVDLFRKAIQSSPGDSYLNSQLAEALMNLGKHDEALEVYQKWVESPLMRANTFVDHYTIARMVGLYRATGKLDELQAKVDADLEKNPTDKMALGIQVHLDKWNKEFGKVYEYHLESMKTGQSPYAVQEIAEVAEIHGNADEVLTKLETGTNLPTQISGGPNQLAGLYMSTGNKGKAVEMISKKIEEQRQYSSSPMHAIREGFNSLVQFGLWDEAETLIQENNRYLQETWVQDEISRVIAGAYVKGNRFQEYVDNVLQNESFNEADIKLIQQIANEYRSMQRPDKQLEIMRLVFENDPDNQEIKKQLAELHAQNQAFETAAQLMRSLVEAEPNNRDLRTTYARYLVQAGKSDQAVEMMQRWCEENPLEERYRALSDIYRQAGHEHAAVQALETALELADSSKKEDVQVEIAEHLARQGGVMNAEPKLKNFFETRQDQNAFHRYFQFLQNYNLNEKAYQFFIAQKDGGFLDRYRNMQIAGLCFHQNDFTTPMDVVWRFARYSDRYSSGFYTQNVVREYQTRGKTKLYLNRFKTLVESETPAAVPMLQSLAKHYADAGYLDEALETYDEVLELNPFHREAVREKADTLLKRGRVDEAVETLKNIKGATNLREEVDDTIALARLYLNADRPDEAERVIEGLLQWASGGETLTKVGQLYFEQEQYEKAIPHLEHARFSVFNHQSSQILSNLGKCYAKTGQAEKALQVWNEAAVLPYSYNAMSSEIYWLQQEQLHETLVEVLRKRIEDGERQIQLYVQLAESLMTLGQTEEMLAVCHEAEVVLRIADNRNQDSRLAGLIYEHDLASLFLDTYYRDTESTGDVMVLDLLNHTRKEDSELLQRLADLIHLPADADPGHWQRLANGLSKLNDDERRIVCYEAILHHPESTAVQKIDAAFEWVRLSQREQILPVLQELFQQHPNRFIQNEQRFRELVKRSEPEAVEEILKQVNEYCAFDSHRLYYSAVADMQRSATDEALVKMERLLDLPNLTAAHLHSIANTFRQFEKSDLAVQTYERLTQPGFQSPTRFNALRQLAELRLKNGDYPEAVSAFAGMYPFGENHASTEVQDMLFDALNAETRPAIQAAFIHAIEEDPGHDRVSDLLGIFHEMLEAQQLDTEIPLLADIPQREKDEWQEWNDLIETWSIAGPYNVTGMQGDDSLLTIEQWLRSGQGTGKNVTSAVDQPLPVEQLLSGNVDSIDKQVEWKAVSPKDVFGWIELDRVFGLDIHRDVNNKVAYAKTEIESPEDRYVYFSMGSDDWVKVWVNGKEVHRFVGSRSGFLNQDRFGAQLQKGKNTILVKIGNNTQDWRFSLRVDQGGEGIHIAMHPPVEY